VSGRGLDGAPPWRVGRPPRQESSLRFELCCLGPSPLNRPHPSHSRAHRDFTARRLIGDAFAVRERRGDPRVVPGFRCPFLPNMPSSLTPGSSINRFGPELRWRRGLRRDLSGSALPILPQSVSRGARISGLPGSRICYGLSGCSPPCTDQTGTPSPRELLLPGFQRIGRLPVAGYSGPRSSAGDRDRVGLGSAVLWRVANRSHRQTNLGPGRKKSQPRRNHSKNWMLAGIRAGGHDRSTTPKYWIDGRRMRAAPKGRYDGEAMPSNVGQMEVSS
jgi:hypothetical protein